MNIFKNKHYTMAVGGIILIIFFIHIPLQAVRERRGSTVVVTMTDGSKIKGELLAVKGHDLIIHDKSIDRGFTVNIEQVSEIRLKKRSLVVLGMVNGLTAGALVGFGIYASQSARTNDPCQLTPYALMGLIIPCVTTVIGGGVGAILSLSKKMSIERQSPADIEASLRYLQKHARY
ncbi:MAG: hypothetical protein E4H23_05075 [Chrysiogenales bacterium]|nr:hypothetical protein [Candidatus Aminicenantes bacterium]TFG79667.1 MAG: hypothetical protein E4H23_05075 [Chrysiogenales bacterium]